MITINRSTYELAHKGPVVAADFIQPGDKLISASWDNTLKLWGIDNGRCVAEVDIGLLILS